MSILPSKKGSATITAAARPLNIRNTNEAAQISGVTRTPRQREAWKFYGVMSELNYPTNYLGRNVGRFRFPVGVIPADDLMAAPTVPDVTLRDPLYKLAEKCAFMIRSEDGDISDLAEAYTKNFAVAGEGWLVGRKEQGEILWTVFSVNEFGPRGNGDSWVPESDGTVAYARYTSGNWSKPDSSYKFGHVRRVWQPSPELRDFADTTTFAVLGYLRTLEALDRSLRARIINRLTQSGFLIMPTQFHLAGPVGAPTGDGQVIDDPFAAKLIDVIQKQHDSGEAPAMPAVIRGDAQFAAAVRFLTMDRTIDHVELELRAENRSAVAKGMFLPPEVQEGMGGASHFTAWSVADSAYSHLLPYAKGFAYTMTTTVLWPWLRDAAKAAGLNPTEADIRRHVLVPDGSDVITRPNEAEDGRQLYDRAAIGGRALRDRSGVAELDAPSEEEYVRMQGAKQNNPYLATYGLKIHDKIDWDKVAAVGASPGRPGVGSIDEAHRPADSSDPAGAPGEGEAGEGDDDLSARLLAAAAPGYLLAARKKVGAKLRARCEPNKELHAAIKQVPNEQVLSHVDPQTDLGIAPSVVAGWFLGELAAMHHAVPDVEPLAVMRFAKALAEQESVGEVTMAELPAIASAVTLPSAR